MPPSNLGERFFSVRLQLLACNDLLLSARKNGNLSVKSSLSFQLPLNDAERLTEVSGRAVYAVK